MNINPKVGAEECISQMIVLSRTIGINATPFYGAQSFITGITTRQDSSHSFCNWIAKRASVFLFSSDVCFPSQKSPKSHSCTCTPVVSPRVLLLLLNIRTPLVTTLLSKGPKRTTSKCLFLNWVGTYLV